MLDYLKTLVDGRKVYIGIGVAAVALVVHATLGVNIPGVQVDDANIVQDLWNLAMIGAGRSAIGKFINPEALAKAAAVVGQLSARSVPGPNYQSGPSA